mmetsp:Transcript_57614/g.166803  ORF Transcript_57614/g.166803 Transcript_57614/m.166803 type:complete len:252 (+) Transcript_57614:841-1596(+)
MPWSPICNPTIGATLAPWRGGGRWGRVGVARKVAISICAWVAPGCRVAPLGTSCARTLSRGIGAMLVAPMAAAPWERRTAARWVVTSICAARASTPPNVAASSSPQWWRRCFRPRATPAATPTVRGSSTRLLGRSVEVVAGGSCGGSCHARGARACASGAPWRSPRACSSSSGCSPTTSTKLSGRTAWAPAPTPSMLWATSWPRIWRWTISGFGCRKHPRRTGMRFSPRLSIGSRAASGATSARRSGGRAP